MSNSHSEPDVDDDLDGIYGEVSVESEVPVQDEDTDALMARAIEVGLKMRKKRKKKHVELLPEVPFHITESIPLVPIHSDLLEGPYTDRRQLPMCLLSTRPFFVFESRNSYISAGTCDHSFCCDYKARKRRKEMVSHVSVVDVYDFYGLEMAYSYMHHLYHLPASIRHPQWFITYIVGSLMMVNVEQGKRLREMRMKQDNNPLFPSHVCSILLSELILLDSGEPKLQAPIEPHTTVLPVELLARIFNSTLISKSITEHVTKQRIYRELRPGEVACRAQLEQVMYSVDQASEVSTFSIAGKSGQSWTLTAGQDHIKLEQMKTSEVPGLWASIPVLCSPRDRARLRNISLYDAFSRCMEEIDMENPKQVYPWIVLLMDELELADKKGVVDKDVRDVLRELKGRVLDKLRPADGQA